MTPSLKSQAAIQPVAEPYLLLDHQINTVLNAYVGFNNLMACTPYQLTPNHLQSLMNRYRVVKEFQESTLALFKASLTGDADPEVARLILDELPPNQGFAYHRGLSERQLRTPVFFRTDEVAPGKLSEIHEDYGRSRYWLIQKGYRHKETTRFLTRDGDVKEETTYTKYSGLYGPDGLMGVFVMQKPFFKVHGSPETVLSIAL